MIGEPVDWDIPTAPRLVGQIIRQRFRSGPQLAEAPLDDREAEFLLHALGAFVLPPVESLEDRSLEAFARIVLVDDELGLGQLAFDAQRGDDLARLLQAIRADRLHAFGPQVLGDFPIPHGQGAEFRGNQEDRQPNRPERFTLPVGHAQQLWKQNGFGFGKVVAQRTRLEQFGLIDQQLSQNRKLPIEFVVATGIKIQRNESGLHDGISWVCQNCDAERRTTLREACNS